MMFIDVLRAATDFNLEEVRRFFEEAGGKRAKDGKVKPSIMLFNIIISYLKVKGGAMKDMYRVLAHPLYPEERKDPSNERECECLAGNHRTDVDETDWYVLCTICYVVVVFITSAYDVLHYTVEYILLTIA
jgi:hypothetical protein